MTAELTFGERSAQRGVESVALAHLSIELGHLYAEDFGPDNIDLERHFARIAPFVRQAREDCAAVLPTGVRPRVSTCFLVDDYFNRFGEPSDVVGALLRVAAAHGVPIDYVARESGCAVADGTPLAQLVLDHLVNDPPQRTTGVRPPISESGWLCNGARTPAPTVAAAMKSAPGWQPPVENGPNQHSIFMDVELFSESAGQRTWSCAFLASVWQAVRLGLLRHLGEAVPRLYQLDDASSLPSDWSRLPAVMRVNRAAAPFSAYRTMSVLHRRFLPVEAAVGVVLSQLAVDATVLEQIATRARAEGLELPELITHRIGYSMLNA